MAAQVGLLDALSSLEGQVGVSPAPMLSAALAGSSLPVADLAAQLAAASLLEKVEGMPSSCSSGSQDAAAAGAWLGGAMPSTSSSTTGLMGSLNLGGTDPALADSLPSGNSNVIDSSTIAQLLQQQAASRDGLLALQQLLALERTLAQQQLLRDLGAAVASARASATLDASLDAARAKAFLAQRSTRAPPLVEQQHVPAWPGVLPGGITLLAPVALVSPAPAPAPAPEAGGTGVFLPSAAPAPSTPPCNGNPRSRAYHHSNSGGAHSGGGGRRAQHNGSGGGGGCRRGQRGGGNGRGGRRQQQQFSSHGSSEACSPYSPRSECSSPGAHTPTRHTRRHPSSSSSRGRSDAELAAAATAAGILLQQSPQRNGSGDCSLPDEWVY